jgi:hypothetical protein
MNNRKSVRLPAAIAFALGLAAPTYAGDTFSTLKENIFVCVSPQAYDDPMLRVRELNGKDLEPLKKELAQAKQCMFVDGEMVESIMAPFAVVLDRNGSKVQVQFIVSFEKRVEFLHRLFNRYVLQGWTDEANLEPKQVL